MYSMFRRKLGQGLCQCKGNRKFICTSNSLMKKNHYEILEIRGSATQQEVKQAYYKLSKLYHPDRNKDNPEAAAKFREVAASYEILGNFKLRKLYDKGILHTAGPEFAHQEIKEEEEDPQTKFYKRRMKRSSAPTMTGKSPIYDFDEWAKSHYGSNFERKQKAKRAYDFQQSREQHRVTSLKNDRIVYFILFSSMLLISFSIASEAKSSDLPKTNRKEDV